MASRGRVRHCFVKEVRLIRPVVFCLEFFMCCSVQPETWRRKRSPNWCAISGDSLLPGIVVFCCCSYVQRCEHEEREEGR